jgi:LAO/AO transport system kinase
MGSNDRPGTQLSQADSALVERTRAGERQALARTITLLESAHPDHRARAQAVLEALSPHAGRSIRLGLSGAPGAGKSTFIEALGMHLIEAGHRLAVLAIDPSSARTGGSILGDKTRMARLSRDTRAFIRPSPAAGRLGGVAERTREAIVVCEAAGYDVIVVETVGIGQSEAAVAGMVDVLLLLQLPNAGDDLQAMKKGVMELADVVIVNKADIDAAAASRAARQIETALTLLRPNLPQWTPPVLVISSLKGEGVPQCWATIRRHQDAMKACAEFDARRRRQALDWMWALVEAGLRDRFRGHPGVQGEIERLSDAVMRGTTTPVSAAASLLAASKD